MAIGLTIMHWQAEVDAMDTGFVLGSAAGKPLTYLSIENFQAVEPFSTPSRVFKSRSTHLWIIDFNKASPISFTKQDIDNKLVPAVTSNDPYFP